MMVLQALLVLMVLAAERKRKHVDGTEAANNVCLWRGCASVVFDTAEELVVHVNLRLSISLPFL